MTRKKLMKCLMAMPNTKRKAEEFINEFLPICGSYEEVLGVAVLIVLADACNKKFSGIQAECDARCCR